MKYVNVYVYVDIYIIYIYTDTHLYLSLYIRINVSGFFGAIGFDDLLPLDQGEGRGHEEIQSDQSSDSSEYTSSHLSQIEHFFVG